MLNLSELADRLATGSWTEPDLDCAAQIIRLLSSLEDGLDSLSMRLARHQKFNHDVIEFGLDRAKEMQDVR